MSSSRKRDVVQADGWIGKAVRDKVDEMAGLTAWRALLGAPRTLTECEIARPVRGAPRIEVLRIMP